MVILPNTGYNTADAQNTRNNVHVTDQPQSVDLIIFYSLITLPIIYIPRLRRLASTDPALQYNINTAYIIDNFIHNLTLN